MRRAGHRAVGEGRVRAPAVGRLRDADAEVRRRARDRRPLQRQRLQAGVERAGLRVAALLDVLEPRAAADGVGVQPVLAHRVAVCYIMVAVHAVAQYEEADILVVGKRATAMYHELYREISINDYCD
ncbi:MAG: hypothetical protein F4089_13635 [Gammaproteobacteria bacterium]|nr:hypothetical protein [Gammaproteobacteria bacterium]MYJ76064.1 hypothetical protein [Gammaproteobacteria bacterium]